MDCSSAVDRRFQKTFMARTVSHRNIFDNNAAVRRMLVERGIIPENLLAAEDVKKVERRLESEQKKVFGQKKI